jgi:hypothetical protein
VLYNVYGFAAPEREANEPASLAEQKATPPETVVYSTEIEAEAKKIVDAGGYIGEDGLWIVATRYGSDPQTWTDEYRDGLAGAAIPKPLGASAQNPGDNSSATIDSRGEVHTDPTKKPLKFAPADVSAMAQADLDIPIKKDIIQDKGNLGNYGKPNQGKP